MNTTDMTKRLQVLMPDVEYRAIQRIARERHVTVAQWVREALNEARRAAAGSNVSNKITAIRAAAKHQFPTTEIEVMLQQIESGYAAQNGK
jgi:methylmalonyl-CoA mutase N-terminal domain/subunit